LPRGIIAIVAVITFVGFRIAIGLTIVTPFLLVKLRREGVDKCRNQSRKAEGWWRQPRYFHAVFAYDMQRESKMQAKLGSFGKEGIAKDRRGG
jgi:hypothetical protein